MELALHNTLPFTSGIFFGFMCAAIGLVFAVKGLLQKKIPYRFVLLFINLSYIVLLFPKPIQLIALVGYLYGIVLLLRRFYRSDNLILPMLLLSAPMLFMKWVNVQPASEDNKFLETAQLVIQVAGLSYLIFRVIGLYVDERRSTERIRLVDFFNFSTFVPTLLIGPIDRYRHFLTQSNNGYKSLTKSSFGDGWLFLIKGLVYKFILAEFIHRIILLHLNDDSSLVYHLEYMYTYVFYLYFDFAGYSLLARAFGQFIGVWVPVNFDKPFLAVNPKEFWKKWHKSLGDWLNDYFFKPIFKFLTTKQYFKPITRQNLALFLTFTLMGFWNGFELHYVISGMFFGFMSVIHNYYIYRCKKNSRDVVFGQMKPDLVRIISIFIMFNLVTFSIYIFSGQLV